MLSGNKQPSGCIGRIPHSFCHLVYRRVGPALAVALLVSGCAKLGPDFVRPEPQVQTDWTEVKDAGLKPEAPTEDGRWWKVFRDPVLDRLIDLAYQQNLTLQVAGVRILEARAQLGIAVGRLYPQQQQATANATLVNSSRNAPNTAGGDLSFVSYDTGLTAGWELDFWGRFARGIESADASLLASVANYDDVLVSITAQVATTYVAIRTFERRLEIAKRNTKLQQRGLQLARVRFRNGATTELDVLQALSLLRNTQASVPSLETGRRQSLNALATLLGITPAEVQAIVYRDGGEAASKSVVGIPNAPAEVAVGIPADLLRRRPDVRLAELQAMAQSAAIGVAQADLYPSISLFGTIGLSSGDRTDSSRNGSVGFEDLFDDAALRFQGGPGVTWNVFNYGRIKNNVRVQDARLQQLLVNYQNSVLIAGQEVEDSMVGFLQAKLQEGFLTKAEAAAERSVRIAFVQYRDGATDFTTVLNTLSALAGSQDQLTAVKGSTTQNLIAMYRALGGGWQIREGQDFVSEETREQMRERTDWGGLLDREAVENVSAPGEETETWRSPDW